MQESTLRDRMAITGNFRHEPVYFPDLDTVEVDGKRFYAYNGQEKYPSVTTVLSTLSEGAINAWKQRVGAEEAARISSRAAGRGTGGHNLAEAYTKNEPVILAKHQPTAIEVFKKFRPWLDKNVETVHATEFCIVSHKLRTAGRGDLLATLRGDDHMSYVDYKTAGKNKKLEYIENYLIQATTYCMSIFEMFRIVVPKFVILIASDDQTDCQVFEGHPADYIPRTWQVFNDYHKARAA